MHCLSIGLQKGAKINWPSEAAASLEKLKKAVQEHVHLYVPRLDRQFACIVRIADGAIYFSIQQHDEQKQIYPIAFLSRLLSPTEKNYTHLRQLLAALIYGLQSAQFFLEGAEVVQVFTNARILPFLRAAKG